MISVSIVDDEPALLDSIATFINGSPGFRCAGSYGSAEAALPGLLVDKPDVVLMDINMGGLNGIECVRRLKAVSPAMQIVMFTVYEDTDQIFKALAAGATGYLLKREEAFLKFLAKGLNYKQIADELDISIATVRTYLRRIYEKLHVQSRTEAVAKYLRP